MALWPRLSPGLPFCWLRSYAWRGVPFTGPLNLCDDLRHRGAGLQNLSTQVRVEAELPRRGRREETVGGTEGVTTRGACSSRRCSKQKANTGKSGIQGTRERQRACPNKLEVSEGVGERNDGKAGKVG